MDPDPRPHAAAAPVPHLVAILVLRDRQSRGPPLGRGTTTPAAASFDRESQAELGCGATIVASEVGDDQVGWPPADAWSWLRKIEDPLLHAICQLVMGSTSPITGDFEGALNEVSAALEELRDQDEPFWTAAAAFTAGALETALGHPDSALQHLRVTRELADHFDYAWLTAISHLQLGTLAVAQGRLEEAREQLDAALELSLAIHISRNVTRCLAAFAQLAFAEGDPERGAAGRGGEGPAAPGRVQHVANSTAGRSPASSPDPPGAGDHRASEAFAAGSRLSQQEAVAAIRGRPGKHTQPS